MKETYKREILHFIDCINKEDKPINNVSQGREVLQMLIDIKENRSKWYCA